MWSAVSHAERSAPAVALTERVREVQVVVEVHDLANQVVIAGTAETIGVSNPLLDVCDR